MQRLLEITGRGISSVASCFAQAFFYGPKQPFELLFAMFLFVSALSVLNPTYDIYGSSRTFDFIRWLPESGFGAVLLFVSLVKFLAVCSGLRGLLTIVSGAVFMLFSLMFVLFFSANPTGMLIPWIGVTSIVSATVFVRNVLEYYGFE